MTLFVAETDYEVVTPQPEASYLMLQDYEHIWLTEPGPDKNRFVVASPELERYVTFTPRGLVLTPRLPMER